MRSAWHGARAGLVALALLVACVGTCGSLTGLVSAAQAAEPDRSVGTLRERLRARAQLHRNGLRGVAYVSTWYPDGKREPTKIRMRPRVVINLDGDATTNVRGNVYPIDIDGDGRYELLHYNGHRLMRVFRQNGTKLWELNTPRWRANRSPWHRDTVAVFDVDGDGGEDIVHCWAHEDFPQKVLVARSGIDGAVIKRVMLDANPRSEECHIAAFYVAGRSRPLVLVAGHSRRSDRCRMPWVDTWSRVAAYDAELDKQWERDTCSAGHYAWPVDVNADGIAESFFVGKYLLKPNGALVCTLDGWERDHVDSLAVGDFDRRLRDLEAVAAGLGGTHLYSAQDCRERWKIPPHGRIVDPQTVAAARLVKGHGWPSLFITESGKMSRRHTYLVAPDGTVEGRYRTGAGKEVQFQNANIDGARAAEDRVSRWGEIVSPDGGTRLGTAWYWRLQRLGRGERNVKPQDAWTYSPLVFDFDGDGQDELTVWGRHKLVIGEAVN